MDSAWILSALLSLGHGMTVARAQPIAACIAPVARTESEAAYMVAIGDNESRFEWRIQLGQCKPWECGGRWRDGTPRARSFWQLEPGGASASYPMLLGEDCRPAAEAAVAMVRRCKATNPAHVFSCYAGHPGDFHGRSVRVRSYWAALARIRAAEAASVTPSR